MNDMPVNDIHIKRYYDIGIVLSVLSSPHLVMNYFNYESYHHAIEACGFEQDMVLPMCYLICVYSWAVEDGIIFC